MTNLHVVLIHYPVVNKNGEVIASAVTNLDLHDISRAAKTFGVRSFYVVTPLDDQRVFVDRIVGYWVKGAGAKYNPMRDEALKLISIKASLDEVVDEICADCGTRPEVVVTSARPRDRGLSYSDFHQMLKSGRPYLLALGTAWGLSEDFIAEADHILDPIVGDTDYNHLSVRSAAAIMLDRLMGCRTGTA
ncbi:MAG: RNA methyltransferase [Desulfobacterales bacterium]